MILRKLKGAIAALLLLAACIFCGLGVAQAQNLERPPADLPVALIADQIDFDSETGTVTARGSVEVYYGERTLTADEITYNDETGRITARGNLVLRDPEGTTVFADAADLDSELRDGLVQGAQSVLAGDAKMAAVEARRIDNQYNTLSKAVYSPCKVCSDSPTPLWRIRAERVIHDEKEKIIHYENAYFDVFGFPVAWLPYFQHPDPTVDRASGVLAPSFLSSSNFGYGAKIPYYWVIDGSSDATLTPFFTTDGNFIFEGEFRRVFDSGSLRVSGSITPDDTDTDHPVRGHLDTEGEFRIGNDISWGWDVTAASDDLYLEVFEYDYPDRLNSELFIQRYRPDGYFDVSGLYFQSLRSNEPAGDIPVVLPVFDARYDLDQKLAGGNIGLFTSGYALARTNGREASRLSFGVDWERQEILPFGLALTAFAEGRGDFFTSFDDPTIDDDLTTRITGHVGVEARYPLIWAREAGDTHIIEPVVQAIMAPTGGNGADIPFEDSLVTEFDETNVIDRNHFSGLDNFEEGPRVNLMVRYDAELSEKLRLEASVGRVFRFEDTSVFSSGSGLNGTESDYVAASSLAWSPYVFIRNRARFDHEGDITRNQIDASVNLAPFSFGVSYGFFESDPEANAPIDREELFLSAQYLVDQEWRLRAYARRDLVADDFVNVGGSIRYRNECCEIELFLNRDFNSSDTSPASIATGLTVRLLTLGAGEER
ncbi:MAG: LPS assembly protein LptD [Pseudomonadota bacterium]